MQFKDLPVGAKFQCNGLYNCVKKSSRTAWINSNLWFYFGQKESVSLIK